MNENNQIDYIDKRTTEIAVLIKALNKENDALQKECPHPDARVVKKPGANTGGYDGPDFDSYWTDHTCKVCGKWWRVDRK